KNQHDLRGEEQRGLNPLLSGQLARCCFKATRGESATGTQNSRKVRAEKGKELKSLFTQNRIPAMKRARITWGYCF
ncbi:MAG: hypothetical protein RLO18_06310, partial [Gimesia chilikensis]